MITTSRSVIRTVGLLSAVALATLHSSLADQVIGSVDRVRATDPLPASALDLDVSGLHAAADADLAFDKLLGPGHKHLITAVDR